MPNDIIREARELCERATPGPWIPYTVEDDADVIDHHVATAQEIGICCGISAMQDSLFIARSRTLVPALLDLLAAKDAENARLTAERDAIKQSCDGLCASHDNVYARLTAMAARAEKAEVERDAAVDERDTLMRRHAKQVEVIRHKIDDGGFSPDEQSLLDDLMLPRHFDRRGTEG